MSFDLHAWQVKMQAKVVPEKLRCGVCRTVFMHSSLPEGTDSCPHCGNRSVPHDVDQDVVLHLNWHELRCLVIWAEAFVLGTKADQDRERSWESLKTYLRKYRPEGAPPLTLYEDVEALAELGLNATDDIPKQSNEEGAADGTTA